MFALEFGQVAGEAMASAEAPPSGRAASPESESAPGRRKLQLPIKMLPFGNPSSWGAKPATDRSRLASDRGGGETSSRLGRFAALVPGSGAKQSAAAESSARHAPAIFSSSRPVRAERQGSEDLRCYGSETGSDTWIGDEDQHRAEDVEWLADKRRAGYAAWELRHLGASPAALKRAGFSARNMRTAQFTCEQCLAAGFSNASLRLAGYGAAIEWSFGTFTYSSTFCESEGAEDDFDESFAPRDGSPLERSTRVTSGVEYGGASSSGRVSSWPGGMSFDDWQRALTGHRPGRRRSSAGGSRTSAAMAQETQTDERPSGRLTLVEASEKLAQPAQLAGQQRLTSSLVGVEEEAEESAPAGATAESLALGDIDESVDEAQGSGRASFGSQQGASHGASSKSDNPLEA